MARRRRDKDHEDAKVARTRAVAVIDSVEPALLVEAIKRAPSLRGMIAGYIAEEMFEAHLMRDHPQIVEIRKHDDHNRKENKSDRSVTFKGRRYTIQLKSVQTNSIHYCAQRGVVAADVQNDASDSREVSVPGHAEKVKTTCYVVGEYDILAVPMFPFTGTWAFAYKRNSACRRTTHRNYPEEIRANLLATLEPITYPLDEGWSDNIYSLLDESLGTPISDGDRPLPLEVGDNDETITEEL